MSLPSTPSFRLLGRRALVTGASSGIGLSCAAAMAEAGAEVTCVARREAPLRELVAQIEGSGGKAEAVVCDISDITQLSNLFDGTQGHGFDVVINAAGMARHSSALTTTPADFDAVMAVNLRAAYFLSQHAARAMQAMGRGGSIIHVSSQMGHVGGPERAVYCASKHALEGMVKAMALEWGAHGIRINTLCPTFVKTPLTEAAFSDPEKRAWIADKIALGHPAEVEDMMGAAVFLASDASRMVTGTALMVDGGWTAA